MSRQQVETPQTRQLALISQASMALAEAKTLNEIKNVRDKAEAVRHYAKSIALGLDLQNHAAEIKLRAERKAGELLTTLSLHGGDRKSKSHDDNLKLADLGVDGNQSARWQKSAEVPEKEFQRYLDETKAAKRELSAAGLLQVARSLGLCGTRPNAGKGKRAGSRVIDAVAFDKADQSGHPSIDQGDDSWIDILQEAQNHFGLLTTMLAPIFETGRVEMCSAERKHLRRLSKDIERLLHDLQKFRRPV